MSNILDELESMAKNFGSINPMERGNPMQPAQQVYVDFDVLQEDIRKQAEMTVDSIINFYVQDDFKSESVMVQKRLVDIDNLADIMFCIVSSSYTLKKVLAEIDQGNITPRLIDTQTSLISKKKEYNQQLALMQVYLNDSYKSLANQWMMRTDTSSPSGRSITQQAQTLTKSDMDVEISRGSRDILMKLKQEIDDQASGE
jgi:hypothetical protein